MHVVILLAGVENGVIDLDLQDYLAISTQNLKKRRSPPLLYAEIGRPRSYTSHRALVVLLCRFTMDRLMTPICATLIANEWLMLLTGETHFPIFFSRTCIYWIWTLYIWPPKHLYIHCVVFRYYWDWTFYFFENLGLNIKKFCKIRAQSFFLSRNQSRHYSNITCALWRLKSPAIWLLVQQYA